MNKLISNYERIYSFLPYLFFSILYLFIAFNLPISINTAAIHDDAWFMQNADHILNGRWLGPYSQMTLIKGATYPIFLAVNKLLHAPIQLSLSFLYLLACFWMAIFFRKSGASYLLALTLFIVILFQPAIFPLRIVRENIYPALLIISFCGIAYICSQTNQAKNKFVLLSSGISAGLFWTTREEGGWVIPALLIILLYGLYIRFKDYVELKVFLRNLAWYFCFALIPILTIASINLSRYGSFQLADTQNSAFVNAINSINNVSIRSEESYLAAPFKKREMIYHISPSFSELREYFEVTGKGWTTHGCSVYPSTCGDYANGWFIWALRDGVNSLGYYSSASSANNFYHRITAEITQACNDGNLVCVNNLIPYSPKLTEESINALPNTMLLAIRATLYEKGHPLIGDPSNGNPTELKKMMGLLGSKKIVASDPQKQTFSRLSIFSLQAKKMLLQLYSLLSVPLLLAGIVGMTGVSIQLIRRQTSLSFLAIFAFSLWILYFSRVFLISIIDASSFPTLAVSDNLYLLPAFPLLTAASIVSLGALLNSTKHVGNDNFT
jgi:hypothetical protein